MTDFRKGDKVRLNASGVVVNSDKHGTQVNIDIPSVAQGSDNYFFDDSLLVLVERTAVVGDSITRADARMLPAGSVIRSEPAGFTAMVGREGQLLDTNGGEWLRSVDDSPLFNQSGYTVAYIPTFIPA